MWASGAITRWKDRGDPLAWDDYYPNMAVNGVWTSLNLSSIVGARRCKIDLRVYMTSNPAPSIFEIALPGTDWYINQDQAISYFNSVAINTTLHGITNQYGRIWYKATTGGIVNLVVSVRGWRRLILPPEFPVVPG